MLREVKKRFDIDSGITVQPGDVVDVSEWKNAKALEDHGFIGETKAEKVSVAAASAPKKASTASNLPVRKRSVLTSRPRVFTRKAKQGE